jgi:hypothetical protein
VDKFKTALSLTEDHYFLGVWYTSTPYGSYSYVQIVREPNQGDWLARIEIGHPHQSPSTYMMIKDATTTEGEMIEFLTSFQKMQQMSLEADFMDHLFVRGAPSKLLELAPTKDWLRIRESKKED